MPHQLWYVIITKSIFIHINSSISNNSVSYKYSFFIYTQLNVKTVPFQTVQFSISTQFSSIWTINRTLSGTTTLSQSGPGSDSIEGILRIPQSSSIAGTLPSDCLVSYPGHLLGESYHSAEMQSILQPEPTQQKVQRSYLLCLSCLKYLLFPCGYPLSWLLNFNDLTETGVLSITWLKANSSLMLIWNYYCMILDLWDNFGHTNTSTRTRFTSKFLVSCL